MNKNLGSYLAAIFAFSIFALIAVIAILALIFVLNYSGFNITTMVPNCIAQVYLTIKLTYLYLPLRAHTTTGLALLCLAVVVLVLAIKLYWPFRELSGEASEQYKVEKKSVTALYILVSCELLCTISNAGGKLSLLIDNGSCTMLQKKTLIILMIASMIAFLAVLVQWLLVIALDRQAEPQKQPISLRDVNEVAKEEDAMSKHLELQMKEYFSNNMNQKEEMMEGLLKREDQIYGGIAVKPQISQTPSLGLPPDQKQPHQEQQQQDKQKEKKSKKKEKNRTDKAGKKKRMNNPSLMHSYSHQTPQEAGEGYNYGKDHGYIEQDSDEDESQQAINEEFLYAQFDDNLSEKFDQNNFELNYDLEQAIKSDKEEDLSPLQLKQLMHLTKAEFALKGSSNKGLQLNKTYDNPEGFKININFVKIKEYKEVLQGQIQKLIDEPNPAELTQTHEKQQEKKGKEELVQKPITEQTTKLLKVMLFNNSEFYKKREEKQTQCPISKYMEHDDGFEIIQSNEKADKHKRFEYAKEQLLFFKKRKDNDDNDNFKDKGTVRQEFNEGEFIKLERKALFGEDWINEHDRKQGVSERTSKSHKRKLVEVIRSKYYQ